MIFGLVPRPLSKPNPGYALASHTGTLFNGTGKVLNGIASQNGFPALLNAIAN